MKTIVVNGSPKTNRNTARILHAVAKGIQFYNMQSAITQPDKPPAEKQAYEIVDLYKLNFKGCIACLGCKIIGGKSYGRCAIKDGITPVLEKLHNADIIIFGTPVYFGTETAEMRKLLERLWFQYSIYSTQKPPLAPEKQAVAMIYTMEDTNAQNCDNTVSSSKYWMEMLFGSCKVFLCTDTLQFDDFSKYDNDYFDINAKLEKHGKFDEELQKAFEFGKQLLPADTALSYHQSN